MHVYNDTAVATIGFVQVHEVLDTATLVSNHEWKIETAREAAGGAARMELGVYQSATKTKLGGAAIAQEDTGVEHHRRARFKKMKSSCASVKVKSATLKSFESYAERLRSRWGCIRT